MHRLFLLFLLFSWQIHAWEGHFILTYAALSKWPHLSTDLIKAESLENFVNAEKSSLVKILRNYEEWAAKNIIAYPPVPQALLFDGRESEISLTKAFLRSLRINPDLNIVNFVLYDARTIPRLKKDFSSQDQLTAPLSSLALLKTAVVKKIAKDELVSPLEIIASATEEPDHGLDFDLWSDNKGSFGKETAFGTQPFGNPQLSFSSQAPFHMGLYYEKAILYWVAPFLKRCYPEYRISLFMNVAHHAFLSGHYYWGYRFLGWALHYLQDLTQPYHARLAPGFSWPKLIALNFLDLIGIKKPAQNLRQLLTNRHLALETYELESLLSPNSLLTEALADFKADNNYSPWQNSYARTVVAHEAHGRAEKMNLLVRNAFSPDYVDDPAYLFNNINLNLKLRENAFLNNPSHAQALEDEFLKCMRAFGAHTRNAYLGLLPKG
jgi:hypothetical protein